MEPVVAGSLWSEFAMIRCPVLLAFTSKEPAAAPTPRTDSHRANRAVFFMRLDMLTKVPFHG